MQSQQSCGTKQKRQLEQIRLLSASACELKVMKHFLAETLESADTQGGIQGYSVASVDTACDVTSEVTECESGVRLCLYQPGCGAFYFKWVGGECSTALRCSCCKGQKGGTGHGRSGNTNPLTFTLSPTLASFCLVQNVRAHVLQASQSSASFPWSCIIHENPTCRLDEHHGGTPSWHNVWEPLSPPTSVAF